MPIPAFLAGMTVLWLADLREPHESVHLLALLNFVFTTSVSFYVAFLAAASFRASGSPMFLALGCAALGMGTTFVVVAALAIGQGPNVIATIHNLGVLLAGVLHLHAAVLVVRPRRAYRAPGLALGLAYVTVVALVLLVTVLAVSDQLPPFFVPGAGGTRLRQGVLSWAAGAFLLAGFFLARAGRGRTFHRWYALGLVLVGVGLLGVLVQPALGSAQSWAGRAAQYLGGVYMLIASLAHASEARRWQLPLALALRDATARCRVAEEREALFRIMADGAPVLIWLADEDERCTWFNKPWLSFTGRTMVQELGSGWMDGIHPEDLERRSAKVRAAFDRREPFQVEYRLRRHDGAWRWILEHGVPRDEADGRFAGFVGSGVDVTTAREDRERAEATARDLDVLLNTAQVGIAKVVERRVVWTNRKLEEMLGYRRDEVVGQTTRRYYPDAERYEALGRESEPILSAGRTFQAELELVRRDGTRWWARYNGMPLDPADLSKGVLWVLEDVTEQHLATQRLAESEARLASMFASMAEGVVLQDASRRFIACNAAATEILGVDRDELAGRVAADPCWRTFHEDGTSFPGSEWPVAVVLRTGLRQTGVVMAVERPDGSRRWVQISAEPLRLSPDGPVSAVVTTFSDITELRAGHERVSAELARNEALVVELRDALQHVRTLTGLLPICMHCHKIRDDSGYWARIEAYLSKHTDATFTHGLCPECLKTHYSGHDQG